MSPKADLCGRASLRCGPLRAAATIYAKHLEPMAVFYGTCFGLAVVAEAPGSHVVLESGAWTLSLVQIPAAIASTIELSDPPVRREETPIKLSFEVPSIAALRAAIAESGGRVDEHEWEYRGFRHCDCVDPEGNVSEIREAVPEP